jgi:hypothetical protein
MMPARKSDRAKGTPQRRFTAPAPDAQRNPPNLAANTIPREDSEPDIHAGIFQYQAAGTGLPPYQGIVIHRPGGQKMPGFPRALLIDRTPSGRSSALPFSADCSLSLGFIAADETSHGPELLLDRR